jgi:aryl-alcohol dehydrogenase-like predicted oxidoreductase
MHALPKSKLGRTGLNVTKLGYGSMELRGTDHFPRLDAKQASTILNAVVDNGINFIDTSPDYGYAEALIGEHLAHRRAEFFLASKCGCPIEAVEVPHDQRKPHDFCRANVRAGVEQSLRRLRTDHLDLVQFHLSPSPAELAANDSIAELLKLKDEGKIRFIGISGNIPHLADHIAMNVFDIIQCPYSLVERDHEDLIHQARLNDIGVIIRGGVARGVMVKNEALIDDYPAFLQPAFRARRKLWSQTKVDDLLQGMTTMEFMLRFTLSNPDMTTTIVGTANPQHLLANVKVAAKGPLPADIYAETCKRFPKSIPNGLVM